MITRPLELSSRLRPEPRTFDWLFYINGGLIVLFFSLFGSQFVLAPGLGVTFRLPTMPGALAGAAITTHRISVVRSDLIFTTGEGAITAKQLRGWLERKRKKPSKLRCWSSLGQACPPLISRRLPARPTLRVSCMCKWGRKMPRRPRSVAVNPMAAPRTPQKLWVIALAGTAVAAAAVLMLFREPPALRPPAEKPP